MININTTGILSPPKSPDRKPEEIEDPFSRAKELADNKISSKFVRVLTVSAYILSVSMVAILLSLYYVFLWDPTPPDLEALEASEAPDEPEDPMALRDFRADPCLFNNTPQIAYMMSGENNNSGNDSGIEPYLVLPVKSEEPVTESRPSDNSTEILLNYTSWNDTDQLSIPSSNITNNFNDNFLKNSVLLQRLITPQPDKEKDDNT